MTRETEITWRFDERVPVGVEVEGSDSVRCWKGGKGNDFEASSVKVIVGRRGVIMFI